MQNHKTSKILDYTQKRNVKIFKDLVILFCFWKIFWASIIDSCGKNENEAEMRMHKPAEYMLWFRTESSTGRAMTLRKLTVQLRLCRPKPQDSVMRTTKEKRKSHSWKMNRIIWDKTPPLAELLWETIMHHHFSPEYQKEEKKWRNLNFSFRRKQQNYSLTMTSKNIKSEQHGLLL